MRPLGAAALEMAVVAAVPASVLAAKASGLGLRASLAWGIVATTFSVGASLACEPKGLAPGYVAQLLIDSGRDACPASAERHVRVPIVAVEWSCPEGKPARASGTLPFGRGARYSARSIEVSGDLRTILADGLMLETPAGRNPFGVRLAAERSKITGLPPWGRPSGPSAARVSLGLGPARTGAASASPLPAAGRVGNLGGPLCWARPARRAAPARSAGGLSCARVGHRLDRGCDNLAAAGGRGDLAPLAAASRGHCPAGPMMVGKRPAGVSRRQCRRRLL